MSATKVNLEVVINDILVPKYGYLKFIEINRPSTISTVEIMCEVSPFLKSCHINFTVLAWYYKRVTV